jgi:hypothetical protein
VRYLNKARTGGVRDVPSTFCPLSEKSISDIEDVFGDTPFSHPLESYMSFGEGSTMYGYMAVKGSHIKDIVSR